MKELFKVPGGRMERDEENNRLILNVTDATHENFTKLIDQLVPVVQEHQIQDCLIEISEREGASNKSADYAAKYFKEAMNHGLHHVALVMPANDNDREVARGFIKKIRSSAIRGFSDKQHAVQWLDDARGGRKMAA